MKTRKALKTLISLILPLVLTVFLVTCDGGYQPTVTDISFYRDYSSDNKNLIDGSLIIRQNDELTLVISCVKPSSISDDKLTITYSFDINTLKETERSYDSKDVDEDKSEYDEKNLIRKKTVLNKISSFYIVLKPQKLTPGKPVQITVTVDPGNVTKTCDITVVADAVSIVTFDKNGGDTHANPRQVATSGTTIDKLPTEPTRAGYTFAGWYTNPDVTGTAFTTTTTVSADMIVYAQWRSQ